MSKRKPHNDQAGYIAEKKFWPSESQVVIYNAHAQGLDTGGKKYAVVCSRHSAIVGETSLPKARMSMKFPEFCEECMAIDRKANPRFHEASRIANQDTSAVD